ncbi:LysR family transcriptional regulator [Cupriavidus pauculus]|uniref:LysR family transcriptional regulator n=1 Tax=Cupriavidus pauculus TaxID=82633 RepID=A0A2N5CAJ0_9BURK|nr:LysR family transcriptional regulator [Cupriavidus pauculus]PLP99248.1 LysR family transcriptional regulator [Cupriavidus pauculus]
MRLEDLNYFVAVAQAGQIARAAEQMGQSQPALTKAIQRLEQQLGIQLFVRSSRGMDLTTSGTVFLERILNVRSSLHDAIREANDLHLGKLGVVRVGVPSSLVGSVFSDAFADLIQQRPAARVQVTIGLNDPLVTGLRRGELDLCIATLPHKSDAELKQTQLFDDDLVVVARDQHPLHDKRSLRLAHLGDFPWLLPNADVIARKLVDACFTEAGLPPPTVALETNSSAEGLMAAIRKTDLLTVIGHGTLVQSTRGLRALDIPDLRWSRSVGILRRQDGYHSPLANRLVEILIKRAATLRTANSKG